MELARFPSHGRFSVRSIFIYALAAFTTVLLWVLLASTPVGAADATWNGASIEHDGRSYFLTGTTSDTDSLGLPAGSKYYVALEETPTSTSTPGVQKAYVIYLAPGADPPGDGTATSLTYDYTTATREFSSPSASLAITTDVASFSAEVTTCAVQSVGWFVCPAMNFLAWGMDTVFGFIADFMEVQPLQVNNTQGALYNAWNIMRSIANIAFIIVFLIIIYSQLTSIGIGNYGIKRMLPRLVIAAVAINVSYIISAIAVDASNILGYSIHQMLTDLRNTLMATGATDPAANAELLSFESITGFVLSGGTAALAGVIGVGSAIIATGGTALAAVFILLPALVGLLLTVLVVLLILAARQALIVILVIIAPLALVAYLLPNTEKWFEKWRDTFMTMLIFFPAFSVVFGGSQLAGGVIIQNATSLNMLILGLIVQVAPLVITPLLLKFSGSVLGGVAKLINDPNKGLVDRTRNWSKSHADWHANRGRGGLDRNGNPLRDKNGKEVGLRKRNALRQSSRYLDQRKRRRTDRTALGEAATQDAYENSNRYSKTKRDGSLKLDRYGKVKADLSQQKAYFEHKKEQTHAHHADVVDQARRTYGSMLAQPGIDAEAAKERAEASKNKTAEFYNGIRYDANYANKVGGKALHMSSYGLEVSKARLEESQNHVKTYYDMQRTTTGTALNGTVRGLETSKLNVEIAGNNVTAMVENMKLNVNSDISVAARNAQSSKEHLEVAQNQLQAFFDTRRATEGTELNLSTVRLEGSKSKAEESKANLTKYIADERSTGSLRETTIVTEQAKQEQQRSEQRLTRIIEEFKSGGKRDGEDIYINGQKVSDTEKALANEMFATAEYVSAETQGIESAKYEGRQRISKNLAEKGSAHAAELLDIAGSIDDNGQQRALATALAQRSKARREVLDNIESIIGFRNLNTDQIRQLAEGSADEIEGIVNSQDVTAAAIKMTLSGKDSKQVLLGLENIDLSFPDMSEEDREELQVIASEALASNPARPPFMTAGFMAMMKSGKHFDTTEDNDVFFSEALGEDGVDAMILKAIQMDKLDSKKLQTAGKDYASIIRRAIKSNPDAIPPEQMANLMNGLAQTLDPTREASEGLADSRKHLEAIFKKFGGQVDAKGNPIMPETIAIDRSYDDGLDKKKPEADDEA